MGDILEHLTIPLTNLFKPAYQIYHNGFDYTLPNDLSDIFQLDNSLNSNDSAIETSNVETNRQLAFFSNINRIRAILSNTFNVYQDLFYTPLSIKFSLLLESKQYMK